MALSPEEMLLQLAGEIPDVRRRIEGLESQTQDVQELEAKVAGLRESLNAFRAVLDELVAQPTEGDVEGPGTAPDWSQTDQEEARELWDWLLTWCGKILHPTYARHVWRPCWYRHQRLRIELTWLCAYWHWSYEHKTAPPTRAAEWHGRWWPQVEELMKKELARCGHPTEDLREPRHSLAADRSLDDFADDDLTAFVEADIARRPPPAENANG